MFHILGFSFKNQFSYWTNLSNCAPNAIHEILKVHQTKERLLFESVELCCKHVLLMLQNRPWATTWGKRYETKPTRTHLNNRRKNAHSLTSSGWTLVVVFKHLHWLSNKEDFFSYSNRDVWGKHLHTQGELLQRRCEHVLFLDQSLRRDSNEHKMYKLL